jgi:outer membrane protein assembly complex protein YaeT
MTVCRSVCRRTWGLAAALAVVAALVGPPRAAANDSPAGREIEQIVPVGNRLHPLDQILNQMHSRPGKPYNEALIQEDVRRLHATKWFVPGSIEIRTAIQPDGRVIVFVHLAELSSTVQEVQYVGAEHLRASELQTLSGVRKGDPMNPLTNELGRQALIRRYQEDGRYFASVELVEGGKPSDTRVVYQIIEGPVVKVTGVQFKGNHFADGARLRTVLMTKRQFAGFFGGKFNPMTLEMDRQRLTEYYQGLGFVAAQITPEVMRTEDPGHVVVVYHIEEGERYRVADLQIDGAKSLPTPTLQQMTEQKVGGWYDRRTAQADMTRMRDAYGYRGHAVGIEEKLYEVPDQPGVVRVHYQVQGDGSEPDRVGRVIIEGNTVTKDRVILNQLNIWPGQILQYPEVENGRIRLARLGIFDQNDPPQIEIEQNELDNKVKDIRVRVHETRTGQFMVGGGVNSNAGVSGSIVINESNFDITRFPTSWDDFRLGRAWRGAGQQMRIEAVPGTIFQRYSATFREPYLFDTKFGNTDSVYYFNRQYAEYFENRVGGRFTLDRQLDPFWRVSATTRVEGVEVKNVPVWAPPAITDDIGWHFLLGLRAGVTRDSRDSFIFPTTGSVFDFGVEQVLGDFAFPIGTAEFTKFFSSKTPGFLSREDGSGKHVLAVRSQVAVEGANAPVYERFFGGGFRSLRGFTFRGVGPAENDLFIGGTFSFINTLEYQIPIMANDKLFFVTFLDHGTIERSVEIRNYRVTAGFGFRIAVPALGPLPIALDFGFPIVKAPQDNRQMFSFYVGLFGGPGPGY